ncbi:MAG: carbon starvation protein A [Myxococcales bacterium]|nr:carbon starvation protein A [Myxococcales bacterium]MCB9707905.1 carbon starvation protein A [Myxococcales bacterium]
MTAAPIMISALCVLAIAYRYYSAFIAARVLVLDDTRITPAHVLRDGHNYVPTHRWVLFGHHFAAISGSGPLIGPTLAAQFGFAPGFIWLLAGVVLAGATHDCVILTASTRFHGRSLGEIARQELGPVPGIVTMIAILTIVIVAIAGLGIVVVGALAESAWATFTVGASIPIALAMGVYSYRIKKGAIQESTVAGVVLLLLALVVGKAIQDGPMGETLQFSKTHITLAIAAYGFVASVLPVWLLLCPRDYLSSYLKIGTIALLVVGIILVNPPIEAPMVSRWIHGGGPVVKGPLYPFVFITIACGAISGFHALVASGTTSKMIAKESDIRPIGYGAMLMEGLVGITALIAATSMPVNDYLAINTDPEVVLVQTERDGAGAKPNGALLRNHDELARFEQHLTRADRTTLGLSAGQSLQSLSQKTLKMSDVMALSNRSLAAAGYHVDRSASQPTSLTHGDFKRLGLEVDDLPALAQSTNERIAARTGGGVSLAVGMARIFSGLPILRGFKELLSYWYHFAIMFEALFILTTIDTGTRVGRFLVQEFVGRVYPPMGRSNSIGAGMVATAAVVAGWTLFLFTGSIQTIWPMFGIANQLLAVIALAIGTTMISRTRRFKYALVTFIPFVFIAITTITAAIQSISSIYVPLIRSQDPWSSLQGWVNTLFTAVLLGCVALIIGYALHQWRSQARLSAITRH